MKPTTSTKKKKKKKKKTAKTKTLTMMPSEPKKQEPQQERIKLSRKERRDAQRVDRELHPEFYASQTKTCTRCKQDKPLLDFIIGHYICMQCHAKACKAWRDKDLPLTAWTRARTRARKTGIPFTITTEDVRAAWTDTCPIYLVPLKPNNGYPGDNSPSLDRIDNSKGYVPGNIAVVSFKFNAQKNNISRAILLRMLAYMEGKLPLLLNPIPKTQPKGK